MKLCKLFKKEIYLFIILALSVVLLVIPMPFARLQDDEVIYYIITEDFINELNIPAHRGSTLVPFLLWAPALLLRDSLLSMRAVTVLVTILTALLIYFITKKLFDPFTALTSSLLFLFSFHVLRIGMRVALDPFGSFFAILSLFFLINRRGTLSGASFSLAAFSYQFWIPMYPLYIIQAYRQKLSLKRFLAATLIVALILQTVIFMQHGFKVLSAFVKGGGPEYVTTAPTWLNWLSFTSILQGWLEFSILAFLLLLGLALGFRSNPAKWLVSFVILQLLIISLYPSFAIYGGASHYPYRLVPLLALVGGYGFPATWRVINKKVRIGNNKYPIILIIVLFVQFFAFNHLVTVLSVRGINGIHDLGYEHDVKAIEKLKQMDKGGLIVGQTTHGLLVDTNRFEWWGGFFSKISDVNPQLFMAYKSDVSYKKGVNASQAIQIVEVGPYVIISLQNGQKLTDYIEFTPSQIWAFKSIN